HEAILESIGEGVHVVDATGRVTFVNPSASQMLGYTADELLGRAQHSVIHGQHADGTPYAAADCPILASIRDGCVRRNDSGVFWRKDRTSFPVDYIATPIRRDGGVICAGVTVRVVTDRQVTARN